jgi:predicted glycoside hydrolase/deacetylase ChbG (UPF0249 family)
MKNWFVRKAWLSLLLTGFVCALAAARVVAAEDSEIRLIVRADDIGSSHAANVACIECYREGIARSVEVMVSAPWFNEAVTMLRENPGYDVGVHLTLTSEWGNIKWGPLTEAPSLVDGHGHFFPMTSQRAGFPPNTGFLQAKPKLDEVERELRAQIELALEKISNVTHLSCHMGTASSTPELRALVEKLAAEYRLPLGAEGAGRAGRFGGKDVSSGQKTENLVQILENLKPGLWLIVEHPGMDTPEMQAIGHRGYENVAEDRQGVTDAFTSPRVKEVIRRRGIRLISYGDLHARKQKAEAR